MSSHASERALHEHEDAGSATTIQHAQLHRRIDTYSLQQAIMLRMAQAMEGAQMEKQGCEHV